MVQPPRAELDQQFHFKFVGPACATAPPAARFQPDQAEPALAVGGISQPTSQEATFAPHGIGESSGNGGMPAAVEPAGSDHQVGGARRRAVRGCPRQVLAVAVERQHVGEAAGLRVFQSGSQSGRLSPVAGHAQAGDAGLAACSSVPSVDPSSINQLRATYRGGAPGDGGNMRDSLYAGMSAQTFILPIRCERRWKVPRPSTRTKWNPRARSASMARGNTPNSTSTPPAGGRAEARCRQA